MKGGGESGEYQGIWFQPFKGIFFPLARLDQNTWRRRTRVVTDSGTEIITIQMRSLKTKVGDQTSTVKETAHFCELVGDGMVKIFWGRKLGFEPRHGEKDTAERGLMTADEFSRTYPYGRR
ncbi:hypothetical protein MLD38_030267 [Melastoma candidum]|uniref:Uncharacterized protein n=1 Tax=Melastoma candidum TaxID=119954 RepID=A0ACB9MMD0_9MYRT|nr:hypothetical protein MLD38_030267 [Melastoma candidum]